MSAGAQLRLISVVIADDHRLVTDGLSAALKQQKDFHLLGVSHDGISALEMVQSLLPMVAVLDLQMPKLDGFAVVAQIRAQKLLTKTILCTSFDDDQTFDEVQRSGASGFVNKTQGTERLLFAMREVAEGRTYFSPQGSAEFSAKGVEAAKARIKNPLTDREREVLRLIARGMSNKEVATTLGTSEGTVKNQASSILTKLDARDRTQAVLIALRDGWI